MATYTINRVGLYARVSTNGNGQSPEMQVRELREYCERRGWQIAGEYVDAGISGAKDRRPELDRLMADAHRRKFDVVAVWKFDRFARSVSHLLRALDTFRVLGIEFVSLSESLDTATPAGRMVFTVLGAVAELERSLIAERVRAGLRNARAKGKRLGRPKSVVDASRVASLRSQGLGWKRIAAELGIGVGTLYRLSLDGSRIRNGLSEPLTRIRGTSSHFSGKATSMIGPCQEAKSPPDALGSSAGVKSLASSARRVGLSAAVSIRE